MEVVAIQVTSDKTYVICPYHLMHNAALLEYRHLIQEAARIITNSA